MSPFVFFGGGELWRLLLTPNVIFNFCSKIGMMEKAKVVNVYKCDVPMYNVIESTNLDV